MTKEKPFEVQIGLIQPSGLPNVSKTFENKYSITGFESGNLGPVQKSVLALHETIFKKAMSEATDHALGIGELIHGKTEENYIRNQPAEIAIRVNRVNSKYVVPLPDDQNVNIAFMERTRLLSQDFHLGVMSFYNKRLPEDPREVAVLFPGSGTNSSVAILTNRYKRKELDLKEVDLITKVISNSWGSEDKK